MNILIYRYGSICEPDVITGFEELGNHVHEITAEIYNKDLLPSEGVTLLKNELLAHSYDFVFSINFFPFISEVSISFRSAIFAGPWTVRLWNYTPIPSKIHGTAFFYLTLHSTMSFLQRIRTASFICRLPAIQRVGSE